MNATERGVGASAVAALLLDAYDQRTVIERISAGDPTFDFPAAYNVLSEIETERRSRGWRPVGRKIGFTNEKIWSFFGVSEPMWARMWDHTVTFAVDGGASLSLEQFVQPRIEPEVVFGLASPPPPGSSPVDALSCVSWFAAGFEIVQCHYPDWRFTASEATAAFGLHGALVVGTSVPVTERNISALAATMATFKVTLSCNGEITAQGNGRDVLGSPIHALDHLARLLAQQSQFEPLATGEIITTGTLTDAPPIAAGDSWTSDYGELKIEGLTLTFT